MDAVAESLPYADMRFDFAVMLFCVSYFKDVTTAFKEAYRVLKKDGCLIVGFLDKDSIIGKAYEQRKPESDFYRHAVFYGVDKITEELRQAGFRHFEFNQTLFGELTDINSVQHPKKGIGEGSLVVVKAMKKKPK
jgi:ubiquinone/menaquinone biosynthesis C-methylase UbiE